MSQLGEIRIQTPNGVKQVPVYSTGSSGSNILEVVRVETETGIGYIPITDPTDAKYNYIRVKTQSGTKAIHNSTSLTNVNEITTDVTLNSQSIDITIYEDTTGDSNADNTETISLGDGTNTYTLNNLDGSSGNNYWIEWSFSNSKTASAKANYADLKDAGKWNTSSDWDNGSDTYSVHESYSNMSYSDSSVVQQGYSVSNPMHSTDLQQLLPLHGNATNFGSGTDGNVNGASSSSDGIMNGGSLYFDGSDRLDSFNWSNFNSDTSVVLWLKTTDGTVSSLFSTRNQVDDNLPFELRTNWNTSGSASIARQEDSWGSKITAAGSTTVDDGNWHMIGATFDKSAGELELYIDGTKEGSGTGAGFDVTSPGPPQVGNAKGSEKGKYLDGNICWIMGWDRVLTGSEIDTLYKTATSSATHVSNQKSS